MTAADVSALLDRRSTAHAVIGAVALAVHGVPRASDDIDFLVMDPACLELTTWEEPAAAGVAIEIRRGDADDPLAGVVRLTPPTGTTIDVIVGRSPWQAAVLARAQRASVLGVRLPVAIPVDVVLLKLYAGGPQDAWDIDQLLDAVPGLAVAVETALDVLPHACGALWRRILSGRPH